MLLGVRLTLAQAIGIALSLSGVLMILLHGDLTTLKNIAFKTSCGAMVPLDEIVTYKEGVGPQSINHSGQMPSVSISFGLRPGVSLGEATAKVKQVDLMRYGHAMSVPVPGVRSSAALGALASATGRVHFAHSDLAGYSIFEEAVFHGVRAARAVLRG